MKLEHAVDMETVHKVKTADGRVYICELAGSEEIRHTRPQDPRELDAFFPEISEKDKERARKKLQEEIGGRLILNEYESHKVEYPSNVHDLGFSRRVKLCCTTYTIDAYKVLTQKQMEKIR